MDAAEGCVMDAAGWAAARDRLLVGIPEPFSGWLAARVDQLLRLPLSHLNPERGAAGVEARLDAVRARLADMAASGRARRGEPALLARELRAADAEFTRLEARLRPVRALTLRARLAAYVRALDDLPGARPDQRPGRGREAAVFAGAATAGWAALQLGPALDAATVAGPVALGGAAAVVTVAAWRRRTAHRAALEEAVRACDDALPRLSGHLVSDLDRQLREVLRRARAGRLAPETASLLARIGEHLDALLVRALTEGVDPDVEHLVRASVTDYLPDTLDPFLALSDPGVPVAGHSAADELADQLRGLERALARALDRPSRQEPAVRLLVQGEFLRSKFGTS
jgi:hypothetical protein